MSERAWTFLGGFMGMFLAVMAIHRLDDKDTEKERVAELEQALERANSIVARCMELQCGEACCMTAWERHVGDTTLVKGPAPIGCPHAEAPVPWVRSVGTDAFVFACLPEDGKPVRMSW